MVVKSELEKLGLHHTSVEFGEADITGRAFSGDIRNYWMLV